METITQGPPKHCALLLALYLSTLILLGRGEDPRLQISPEDLPLQSNSLAVALGEMLEYNQDNGMRLEKKAAQVPRCDVGERCAMKHGPRIGKLCDCLRGASCNSFMLRCY
ncbi:cocaine- and amphetamine-regulated transcript protein-like [Hyla sarda]|uniref:cocaine- and amphetamine-regulated transcript protein-like n=1 Tax=Hyla sarda TaxID=327740 RepID=UPI0024C26F84|nr:cocaine- and amphetamine-regulated transcript protein-like [Hyla sarda]